MDLQALQSLQDWGSVEETIKSAVRGKTPKARLDIVMELVGIGLEAEERVQEVVVKAWELTMREEWWKARYKTLTEFISLSGVAEGVTEIIERQKRTEGKKRSYEAAAAKRWGGKDLVMILGHELLPKQASKRFLELVQTLSIQLPNAKEAVKLLEAARNARLGRRGTGRRGYRDKGQSLQVQDVKMVLEGLKGRAKRARVIESSELTDGSNEQGRMPESTGSTGSSNERGRMPESTGLTGSSDERGRMPESTGSTGGSDGRDRMLEPTGSSDEQSANGRVPEPSSFVGGPHERRANGRMPERSGLASSPSERGDRGKVMEPSGLAECSDEQSRNDGVRESLELASTSEEENSQDDEPILIGKCRCKDIMATNDLISRVRGTKDFDSKAQLLAGMHRRDWIAMCHRHVRVIASSLKLLTSISNKELINSLMSVQGKDAEEVWKTEEGRSLFRKNGRPAEEADELGPFKYCQAVAPEFVFDREAVWHRYAGEGAMEKFFEDGNVVIEGLLDWIVKDYELMAMVDAEFDMYQHHLREQNGKSNLGWCRNMWHSLVQQAIRQDPVVYALHAAAREDGVWWFVSFPYYTRFADVGDSTGFRHIDINIPELIANGRGMNLVQSAVSLDDESESGCTVIVRRFQKYIETWWSKVRKRKEDTNGWTHDVGKIYKKEDIDEYGDFETVKCSRGDMRMTMGRLLHGSTANYDRVRRVVFPWLLAIHSDHRRLEMTGLNKWEDVHRANRDMVGLGKEPTGQPHKFEIGSKRFAGCVEMRGISMLGDAVLGLRKWDSKDVWKERDIVLGRDSEVAWRYVNRVRAELKRRWKECFMKMVEEESAEFGSDSYFKSLEGLCAVANLNVK